ncbi:MAG: hypothetical protein WKG03_01355, partial [Telluria sp.]
VLKRAEARRLSPQGMAQLAATGFRFDTPVGLALLERAVRAGSSDDKDRIALFERLSPAGMSGKHIATAGALQHIMANAAIFEGRTALVTQMLARGALRTDGHYDQRKIDEAFFTAVSRRRAAVVEMLWQLPGNAPHPALQYKEARDPPGKGFRMLPLTLQLDSDISSPRDGNAFLIAKFLVEKGCDPRAAAANGMTLLHIAAGWSDVSFVRYVLGLGINPSTPGQFGMAAVGTAQDEDVAMVLLEAGTSRAALKKLAGFREYAEKKRWRRVLAWLDAHRR